MIEPSFLAALVASVGSAMGVKISSTTTGVIAVELPPIVPRTQVEDAAAPPTTLRSKTLSLQPRPALERTSPRTCLPSLDERHRDPPRGPLSTGRLGVRDRAFHLFVRAAPRRFLHRAFHPGRLLCAPRGLGRRICLVRKERIGVANQCRI
jgi:hypothetical protein